MPVTLEAPPDALRRLAHAVRRLRPDWRNAEGFYEARSEIAHALAQLAYRLRPLGVAPAVTPTPKPRIVLVRGFPGTCRNCRHAFQASQPTKQFCSHACRQSAYRQRLRTLATGDAVAGPVCDTRQRPDPPSAL
jgi:hypothetical protein